MACKAEDKQVTVRCWSCSPAARRASETAELAGSGGDPCGDEAPKKSIQLFDGSAGDCQGASVKVLDCPLAGTLTDKGGGEVEYTPCENFAGQDAFSYTIEGSADPDPGVGIVEITVGEGSPNDNNCDWVEALHCNGAQPSPRIWVPRAQAERHSVFEHNETCYRPLDCPTCPDPDGTVLENPKWVDGCGAEECTFDCLECGDCCFSEDTRMQVSWELGSFYEEGDCEAECDWLKSGTIDGLTWDSYGGHWERVDVLNTWDDGKVKEEVIYTLSCSDGKWAFAVEWTDEISGCGLSPDAAVDTDKGCCGGDSIGATAGYFTCAMSGPGCHVDSGIPLSFTVEVQNNHCCRCDVGGTPTCVGSMHDYGNDCAGGVNGCNQYRGEEEACDAAAP